jgi:dTDP-4-amino-4,6-dideoxygalactose transaminase
MTPINRTSLFDLSQEDHQGLRHFNQVLSSGDLFRYTETSSPSMSELLERRFASYFGKESAVAVVNGTAAIRLALLAVGVRPGDRVLVSAYSFIACAMTILSVGAVPLPMDMSRFLDLDISSAAGSLASVKAVLAVHVQGHAVPVAAIRTLCDEFGVPLIEDVCQAVGASSGDGRAGELADVAVTSFQQSKQISTGEGGLLAGSNAIVERAYRLADLGAVRRGSRPDWDADEAVIGENLRLTELQAALALDQLSVLEETLARQRSVRRRLWNAFGAKVRPIHSQSPSSDSGGHTLLLAKSSEDARRFCAALAAEGVSLRVVWPKTFMEFGLMKRTLPVSAGLSAVQRPARASALAPRIIGVTVSKYAGRDVIERVADAILAHADLLVDPEEQ